MIDPDWRRRAILMAMAGLAAPPAIALDRGARAASDPFALGVASGDPGLDGFVLWTRLVGPDASVFEGHAITVRYEIAADQAFRRIVRTGTVPTHPESAHSLHLEIAGLPAGRPFWYRFHALGWTSPTGRAATGPARADRLRIALTSCQHWEQARFGGYRDIIAMRPDLILQVGDYIYEQSYPDGPRVRAFGTQEPRDLAGYRQRHALYKTDPDLQAAHRFCPWIATWDDHEVLNDYSALANRGGEPPETFARRRAAAYRAYFEHMPIRPSLWRGAASPRLYRGIDWGDLASLSVLDTRQYRSAAPCQPDNSARNIVLDGCAMADAPDATILGAAQERWLADRLKRERRRWTLIGQQVFFAPLKLDGAGRRVFSDQWDGYAANRQRILSELSRPNVRNPVVLSGDVHSFWVNDLRRDDGTPVGTEVVTSALAAGSPPPGRFGDAMANNPHIRFTDQSRAGYTLLDLSRDRMQIDLRMLDDRTDPDPSVRTGSRFVIEYGNRRAVAEAG